MDVSIELTVGFIMEPLISKNLGIHLKYFWSPLIAMKGISLSARND